MAAVGHIGKRVLDNPVRLFVNIKGLCSHNDNTISKQADGDWPEVLYHKNDLQDFWLIVLITNWSKHITKAKLIPEMRSVNSS